ncbi:MAG TPA: hypothetical protein VF274_07380 [Alphaproteobacteria bacterium]
MVRLLALVLTLALLPATAIADGGAARAAAVVRLAAAAGVQAAESKSSCRARCERLRAQCTGSQCRAAYAACIAGCG